MEFGKKQDLRPLKNGKPICKYGSKCYRKHPSHLQEFSHPSVDEESVTIVKKAEPPKKVTGKITDFFGKQGCSKEVSPQKKKLRQTSQVFEEDSDFSIEDPFETDATKCKNKEPISECIPNKKPKLNSPVREEEPNISGLVVDESTKENSSFVTGNRKNAKEEEPISKEPRHSKKELLDDEIVVVNDLIEELFLVKMPSDFFHFWNFCLLIKRSNPKDAVLNWLGFTLVGPFDVLINNLSKNNFKHLNDESKEQLLCHWRYFYDTPEFQTVLKGSDENGFHIGYFRDDPKEDPVFLASNEATKSYIINPIGDNLFCVIQHFLTKTVRLKGTSAGLEALQRRLTEFCKKHNIALSNNNMKARNERIVAKPFHNAGLVVPFENDVGYRELPLNKTNLKKLLKRVIDCEVDREKSRASEELQEIFILINYANDEQDFGMGLEFGINLFCYGDEYFHSRIRFLLETAYSLLERDEFSQIISAHLKRRTKDVSDLDTLKQFIN